MSSWSLAEAREANANDAIISDRAARQFAHAYTWNWASCWFDSTGNFAFPYDFNHAEDQFATPVDYMDESLFGWWMDSPHGDPTESDLAIRTAMLAYLEHRFVTDGGKDVDGWKDLPQY
ncbi:hypothetical protein FHR83_007090 [Actinoplanes campanulatus]|uniref:Uncharacterized protein n=1 Tax=Actinoplanes campanulatus TaxID=113559 RepID=A0A7W5FI76_9ACTN|nr:hypothetical protein [Actinoplanes campanulatus]MBB3099384.1 hypothetical protein [Actinoplanes campanulatus]